MYFAFDSCTKDKCDYLHDKNNLYKGPMPKGLRTPVGAAAVAAGVAFTSSLPGANAAKVSQCCESSKVCEVQEPKPAGTVQPEGRGLFDQICNITISLDFLIDSGAGRNLICQEGPAK